jgi:twinkle protein
MGGIAPDSKSYEKKLGFINKEFMDYTKDVSRFILAIDNDDVGKNTEAILANALSPDRCFRVVYPYKYKDSNEVYAGDVGKDLEPRGKAGIKELYESAKPYPIAGIIRLRDVSAEVRILAEDGLKKGFVTGEKDWDDHLSLREKLMMVVTGIPKMGKSTWWRDYSIKQCRNNEDMKWAMYTPESRPMRREYLKLMENYAGMGSNPKWKNSMSMDQYKAAERWVDERYILIAPENKNFYNFNKKDTKPKTLDNLFDYFKTLKRNEGIFGFSIDAWNKIDHQRPSGVSETDFISRELDRVLEFCDVHSMCGVIIAHPAKQEKIAGNNYEIPTMYDIKGSSAWNEKADIGVSIHRYKNVNQNENIKGAKPLWKKDPFAPTICSVLAVRFDELAKEGEFETFMDWRKGDRFYSDKRPWMVEQEQSGKTESKADMEHDEAVLGGLANKPDLFNQEEPQSFDDAPF